MKTTASCEASLRTQNGFKMALEINMSSIKYVSIIRSYPVFKTSNHLACKPKGTVGKVFEEQRPL